MFCFVANGNIRSCIRRGNRWKKQTQIPKSHFSKNNNRKYFKTNTVRIKMITNLSDANDQIPPLVK